MLLLRPRVILKIPNDDVHRQCKPVRSTPLSSALVLRLLAVFLLGAASSITHAQSRPTATRLFDAQVGGSFVNGNSDYVLSRFNGYGIYGDLDFRHNLGAEAEYHFISDTDSFTNVYERTYEIGIRYSRHYGRYQPYAKLMIGRGVFNYQFNAANLAYNLGALGAGADIRILRHLNARLDFEYQRWSGFRREPTTLPDSLTPSLLSGGLAYHF